MRNLRCLGLMVWLTGCGVSQAAEWSEHWTATSNTATAITGNIVLRADRIVFANGRSLPISKLRNETFTDDIGTTQTATLYAIPAPADPVLEHGNRLCGTPVNFVVIWRTAPMIPGGATGRGLAVYSGQSAPSPDASRVCAICRYDLAK